ncbi:MAG: 4Fe-4S dicluster domain-containing protein [Candidatus Hodarchaeales archaeon]
MQSNVAEEDVLIPFLRNNDNCIGCARCMQSCRSKKAITMDKSYKPVFDTSKCLTCFSWNCIHSCPDHNIILIVPDISN